MPEFSSTMTGLREMSDGNVRNKHIWESDGKFRIRHQNPENAHHRESDQNGNPMRSSCVRSALNPVGEPLPDHQGGDGGENGQ